MVKSLGAGIQKAVEKYCAENNLSDRLEGYKWEFNLVEDPSRPMLESAPLMRGRLCCLLGFGNLYKLV